MISRKAIERAAKDKQFRKHSRDALRSTVLAASRARKAQEKKSVPIVPLVAGAVVLGAVATWAWRSL